MQIGLVNNADDGVLTWTTILNVGFGDGGNDGTDDTPSGPLAPGVARRASAPL